MIHFSVDLGQFERLKKACFNASRKLSIELGAAMNETAKATKSGIAKRITDELTLTQASVKKVISASVSREQQTVRAVVALKKQDRKGFGLQHFKARQTKTGVKYRISKTENKSKGFAPGAFMGPRPGQLAPKLYGGVFTRVPRLGKRVMKQGRRQGKMGEPIFKLYGISPHGVYLKNNWLPEDFAAAQQDLRNRLERRINFNVLRASGLIKH